MSNRKPLAERIGLRLYDGPETSGNFIDDSHSVDRDYEVSLHSSDERKGDKVTGGGYGKSELGWTTVGMPKALAVRLRQRGAREGRPIWRVIERMMEGGK